MQKLFLVSLVVLCGFNSYLVFSAGLTDTANAFRQCIPESKMEIFRITKQKYLLYDEIDNMIRLVHENIYGMIVMIENKAAHNQKHLIITRGGNSRYFELCDREELSPYYHDAHSVSLFLSLERIEPFIYGGLWWIAV
jgi:hypothetical protein